jgi:hypothetical protein
MPSFQVLPARSYNKLLIDHDATSKANILDLKSKHVVTLASILRKHELHDNLEVHLLHRHFFLDDGEAMVHKDIIIDSKLGTTGVLDEVIIDVAKALKLSENSTTQLAPIMWYSTQSGDLVSYEYAISAASDPRRVVNSITSKKWSDFATDFAEYVWGAGLQDLISLKDKSCMAGLEYVAPDVRALFRVPPSIVTLQPKSGIIETGWTLEANDIISHPQMRDGHVTQTKQTTGGTVAVKHVVKKHGADAFDPKEISPTYTDQLWRAVESTVFDPRCPVAV